MRGGKCWLHGKNEASSLDGLYISGADDGGDIGGGRAEVGGVMFGAAADILHSSHIASVVLKNEPGNTRLV